MKTPIGYWLSHLANVEEKMYTRWDTWAWMVVLELRKWIIEVHTCNSCLWYVVVSNWLCRFCSYNAIKNEAHFVCWSAPYIRDKSPSLLENVILGSLKSFFQSNNHVDISLYLKEAIMLRYSRELANLKQSRCTFTPISPLTSWTLKSTSFHWTSYIGSTSMLYMSTTCSAWSSDLIDYIQNKLHQWPPQHTLH
jgi:hypothetical protein